MKMTQQLHYGDRVYARLTLNGHSIAELSSTAFSSLSALITELRHLCHKFRGLAKLYIRNASQGWSVERPLMLYADRFSRLAEARATAATADVQIAPPAPRQAIYYH